MKKTLQILNVIRLFILLPFSIVQGSKKKAYRRIKKTMIASNLL